jgi:drug/metabolite transporter (DMT)-like permease
MAVGEVSPMLVVSLRWLGAVMLMTVFARNILQKEWGTLRPHLPRLLLMGTLGFTVFNALFYVAAYSTTALNLGIIQGAIPVFVLVGGYFLFGSKVSVLQVTGVVVTIIGICVVAAAGQLQRLLSLTINQGDYLMIIACFLYAGYALNLRMFSGVSPLGLFAIVAAAALVSSLPITYTEYALGNLQWPTTRGWVIVGMITLLPSFLAQICFIQGVSDIGPGRAGIFVNLVPVFASILAVTILHEPFQLFHGAALVLVVFGIWLAERKNSTFG